MKSSCLNILGLYLLVFMIALSAATGPQKCTPSPGLLDCRGREIINATATLDFIGDDIRSIDLSLNEIKRVGTIPEATELLYLNLANNKINNISYDAFDNLDQLTTLILSNNSLTRITDDIFELNPLKLEILKLDGNQIEFIQHFLFYDLDSLTNLDLHNNKISFVHPHAFARLKKLTKIRLDGNQLHTFDSKWFRGLRANMFNMINLTENPWSCDCTMGTQVKWLKNKDNKWFLKALSSGSLTCQMPKNMTGIHIKSISKTNITHLICNPPQITGISEPTKLLAGQNIELDCVVEGLPNASIVWIAPNSDHYTLQNADKYEGIEVHQSGTMILYGFNKDDNGTYTCIATSHAGSIQASTRLTVDEEAITDGNKTVDAVLDKTPDDVKVIASSITCPKQCVCVSRRVDCTGNLPTKLEIVPKDIPADAMTLSLASNKIETIPQFGAFQSLTELRMDDNKINKITSHAFKRLGNLTTLTLRDNLISNLPDNTFKQLKKLTILVLDNNHLIGLGDNVFLGLRKLKWLYLRNNDIASIGNSTFAPLIAARYIHMENNQLPALTVTAIKRLTEPDGDGGVKIQKIFVSDNKFLCDCRMTSVRVYLSEHKQFATLFGDGISCSYPPELDGDFLHAVDSSKLLCNNVTATFDRQAKIVSDVLDTLDKTNEVKAKESGTMFGLWFAGFAVGIIILGIVFYVWRKRGYNFGLKSMKYSNLPGNDEAEEHRSLTTGSSGTEAFV